MIKQSLAFDDILEKKFKIKLDNDEIIEIDGKDYGSSK